MKHILVLTTTYPRWPDDVEPGFVHNLNIELAKSYKVSVIAPHAPGALCDETIDNINIYRFRYFFERWQTLAYDGGIISRIRQNPVRVLLVPLLVLSMLFTTIKLLNRHRVDAIHAHWLLPQGLVALIARFFVRKKVPIIVTSHGADLFALNNGPLKALKKFIMSRSSLVTVVSQAMKTYCETQLNADSPIVVRSMGIDTQNTFIDKTPFKERSGILFVGRLVEKKGVDLLIRALSHLKPDHPNLHLNIVGDGPLKTELQSLSHSLGLQSNVSFIGAINSGSVVKYLNKAEIGIMPSRIGKNGDREGLGLVAAEAIACGCICIVSDLDAIKDVHNCRELTFENDNVKSLTNRLRFALENQEKALQLSSDMKHKVKAGFDWSVVGRDYTRLINSIM